VPRLGNQLVDRRHRWPSLPSFQGYARERNCPRRPLSDFSLRTSHPSASFRACGPGIPARLCSTRKTKSRHPPNCGRALFRSDDHAAVRQRGRSLLESDNGCQRQRLSFIRRGDCANQASRKTQHSQRISWAAVPSKRSSPPAEKSGVCIGEAPLSQAKMP
jgi:hypothetical protein